MDELIKSIVEHYGAELQTVVAMEEMSELTKELSKSIRGKADRSAIIEEMADVIICLAEQRYIHGINLNEIFSVMNVKLDRMRDRINEAD